MAIDQITVHPVQHGFGYTVLFDTEDAEPYLRQGDAFKPWGHAEAVKRATFVATKMYGLDADSIEGTDEDDIAAQPIVAKHDGHDCTHCGQPIPASGKRGRPRKIHVECATILAAEKKGAVNA